MEHGLMKWYHLPEEDATWEDRSFITNQFPDSPLSWGQESAKRGGVVTYYKRKHRKGNIGKKGS